MKSCTKGLFWNWKTFGLCRSIRNYESSKEGDKDITSYSGNILLPEKANRKPIYLIYTFNHCNCRISLQQIMYRFTQTYVAICQTRKKIPIHFCEIAPRFLVNLHIIYEVKTNKVSSPIENCGNQV